jgi:DNA-directed RNA polymerase subunit beta
MLARPGARSRKNLKTTKDVLPLPNLIEIQLKSFDWFITEGLTELFAEINPIEDFTGQSLALYLRDFHFEEPKYDEKTAKARNASYEVPLKAKAELVNKETGEVREQEVFLGDYPWMTERGTFVINGAERVVVSQLVRSPGVFFTSERSAAGGELFGAKVIPSRGAWLELDTSVSGVISVKIDRKRKLPITTLLRAFGYSSDDEIKALFKDVDTGELKYIDETLEKDPSSSVSEALMEVYRRIRPGDLATVENSRSLIEGMFFDFKRYDFSKVGRYKLNKRLGLNVPNTADHRVLRREDLVAIVTEIVNLQNGHGQADDIDNLANRRLKMVGELMQSKFRIGLARMERIVKDRMSVYDTTTVTPGQLVNVRPIVASVREFFASSQLSQFMSQINPLDEVVHKRRLNAMGPGGLSRERAGFEVRDVHKTHYGRLCPVETPEGPNIGLVSNLATYARVNEYGFIETPYRVVINEVPAAEAAGEIARGQIKVDDTVIAKSGDDVTEAMVKKLTKAGVETVKIKARVTAKSVWLDASDEENTAIAGYGVATDEKGYFTTPRIAVRLSGEAEEIDADSVDYMDVSSKQIVSVSASLIPFVEHDNAKRALMGANMQKQAVALIKPEAPIVGTGMEEVVARDSGQVILAEDDGMVDSATAKEITVTYKNGDTKTYELTTFVRSNVGTSIHQKCVVSSGEQIKKGDVLIDGMSTKDGELGLGQNVLVAFMNWKGFNFEDAIVLSQRLVNDDRYTSIHIETHTVDVRDTKLGPEQVTRDIANVSEESLKDLDESGIVRIGAEVTAGDILVGKITPKGEQELSSEEKLLRAIFGEKARDVKDTSLRLPNGERGKVVGVKVFSRENGDELQAGVIEQYHVSVAQMRKITMGDKMAGRHGNKGVIARILPLEDMPYLEDGTPVDMILNPLGVGKRMNIGQIFEIHLGWAAQALGYTVASPVFDGVSLDQIKAELKKAGLPEDGKTQLFNGQTGEPMQERTTVGYKYMLKLQHMVDDKIHARSTGPYAMVTQQPLGGKAQMGGQRFGEMEVWALEAYGAAHTLQEILTIKSDDVVGRSKAYEAIIKSEEIRGPRIPESFNVLVKELQSLGLAVDLTQSGVRTGEIDAESVISERLEDEITDLGTEKMLEGEAVVADMPLVDLAASGDDEFETLETGADDSTEDVESEVTVEG